MKFFKKNKLLILSTVFTVLFLLILYFNLGKIISNFFKIQDVEKQLEKQTGLEFQIISPKFNTTKTFCFNIGFENLTVSTKSGEKLFVSDNTSIKAEIIPLIFKRIHIRGIFSDLIQANITRDKNGVFDIEKYFNKKNNLDFKINCSKAHIAVKDYLLFFKDEKQNSRIVLAGKDLISHKTNFKKGINFKTHGEIVINGTKIPFTFDIATKVPLVKYFGSRKFKLNAEISNLDLSQICPYVKELNPKISNCHGFVDLKIISEKVSGENLILITSKGHNLLIEFPYEKFRGTIRNEAELNFNSKLGFNKNILDIKELNILSEGIDLSIKGQVRDFSNKKAKGDLNAVIKNSQLNNLISLLPDSIQTPHDSIRKIKLYNGHSLVDGTLQIKGTLLIPDIYGKINFREIYILKKDPQIPYANGFCEFKKDSVDVNVHVPASATQWVDVVGNAQLYDAQLGKFRITSSDAVDLKTTHTLLMPIHDTVGFLLGPLPFMKLTGTGAIDITTEGNVKFSSIKGWFVFKNASASIQGLNAWLNDASGKIAFKGEEMFFENWQAKLKGAPVAIKGKADTRGSIDMDFLAYKINFKDALEIAKTSSILNPYTKGVEIIQNPGGKIDFWLNLQGKLTKFDTANIITSLKPHGDIKFYNTNFQIKKALIELTSGYIAYGENYIMDLKAKLHNSPLTIKGSINPKKTKQDVDLDVSADKISSDDIYELFLDDKSKIKKIKFYLSANTKITGYIPFNINEITLDKIKFSGWIKGINREDSTLRLSANPIKLEGHKATIDNLRIGYLNSNVTLNGTINKFIGGKDKKLHEHLQVNLKDFRFDALIKFLELSENPLYKKLVSDFSDYEGTLTGDFSVANGKFRGTVTPYNLSAFSKIYNTTFALKSGEILLNGTNLKLRAFNLMLGETPFYLDTSLKDFTGKTEIRSTFSTNLSADAMDKFINSKLTYPIKLNGEVELRGKLVGFSDNYTVEGALSLNPGDDLTYMGANFGDLENKREIRANINFAQNTARINNLGYIKYVVSQNNKTYALNMIKITGDVKKEGSETILNNLRVKTLHSITAKIFNICFKKSVLKQGLFNCDLNIEGNIKAPKITGAADFKDINIPLYDLKIHDIDLNLSNDMINGLLSGKTYESDIKVNVVAQNSLTLPVVVKDAQITSNTIDLAHFADELTRISKLQKTPDATQQSTEIVIRPNDLIIEQGSVSAQNVKLYNTSATNLSAKFSQAKNQSLKVEDMVFDIAGGKITTQGTFNFDTVEINLKSKIENCDANTLATNFLRTPNQIFGTMNGNVTFSGKNLNTQQGLGTIKSKATFEVLNGKMPKLGSLEYLLRAGNLYKSGVLGFTLNNLIEVLIPYKTGDFKSIKGILSAENGFVNNVEIFSKGENLSIFLQGTYDLITQNADITVYGRLSKKVSSVLGFIGNTSVNSLINVLNANKETDISESEVLQNINKIPLIDISPDDYRVFTARITGDLNKDNYVKTFNWLN